MPKVCSTIIKLRLVFNLDFNNLLKRNVKIDVLFGKNTKVLCTLERLTGMRCCK